MSTEGMTIDVALAHANCSAALSSSPAHVAEAFQVLAARVAELEKQHERDMEDLAMYERWATDSPVKEVDCGCGVRHSVRVADADLNTSTGTEWAARWPAQVTEREDGIDRDVTSWDMTGEVYARRVHDQYPRETELVERTLGPWRVSS